MEVARIRGQLTPDKKLCCCKKAARCFVSVSSYLQYKTSSAIFYYTLALDLPLRKLNYVLFSSAYSLVRGFLWCKLTCTVTVCDTPLDGPPSVDSASSSRHRSIAGYRRTIVVIAAGRSSVHSMRWNQILGQNPDFSLPHVYSTPPLGGGSVGILL